MIHPLLLIFHIGAAGGDYDLLVRVVDRRQLLRVVLPVLVSLLLLLLLLLFVLEGQGGVFAVVRQHPETLQVRSEQKKTLFSLNDLRIIHLLRRGMLVRMQQLPLLPVLILLTILMRCHQFEIYYIFILIGI